MNNIIFDLGDIADEKQIYFHCVTKENNGFIIWSGVRIGSFEDCNVRWCFESHFHDRNKAIVKCYKFHESTK